MTQNIDAGTDLNFAIGELLGVFPPGVGVELTYQEVLAADMPQRAALLAAQVADKKPELIGLQEVTLWRTGASVDSATTVLFDQLQLLLSGLAADGVPYDVVAVDSLADIALPKASGGALRFTDRDVLLVRACARPRSIRPTSMPIPSMPNSHSADCDCPQAGYAPLCIPATASSVCSPRTCKAPSRLTRLPQRSR